MATGEHMFLQEVDATVVMFDLRGFTALAGRLGPLELGGALGRYYEFVKSCVDAGGGQLIKFMGDVVMSAWVHGQHGDAHGGHRQGALVAVRAARDGAAAWRAANVKMKVPEMTFSVAAATGRVLAGQIGTGNMRQFDVLGAPANVAVKLTAVATARNVDNLVTAEAVVAGAAGAVEVEGIELGGHRYRLYRIE